MQRRNGEAYQRRLDRRDRVAAPHEMQRHADRDVGDGKHFPRKGDGLGRGSRLHEVTKADACRLLGHAEEFATAEPAGLNHHEEDEGRPLGYRLPQRRIAFER
jgi:hypothetical protein